MLLESFAFPPHTEFVAFIIPDIVQIVKTLMQFFTNCKNICTVYFSKSAHPLGNLRNLCKSPDYGLTQYENYGIILLEIDHEEEFTNGN